MLVDRNQFLFLASALAATTSVGCDREPFTRAPAPNAPAPNAVAPVVAPAAPAGPIVVEITEPPPVACDDLQGVPEECPSVGPSDEGVCPNVIQKRCSDFKSTMKPRVAAQAVACLRSLKGAERCDPARINQCGHLALMSACAEPARPRKGEYHAANGTQPASVTITPDPTPDASPVASSCNSIVKACGERPLSPSPADCRQTLAGLTESGRANMVECVTQHCSDRGLLGCEAAPKVVSANTGAN